MRFLLHAALLLGLAAGCRKPGADVPRQIDPARVALSTRRVIVYGDSRPAVHGERFFMGRSDPAQERALVIRRIVEEKPDLVIHSGDLVAQGSSAEHWDLFDETHQPIFGAGIPFHSALGNHEYVGDSEKGLRFLHRRFPIRQDCRWYAVRAEPLLFLLVDSNFESLEEPFVRAQDEWFRKSLQDAEGDANIKAAVVVSHHPPYTNSKVHSPYEETRRRFADPAHRHSKFKLYVAGHVHNYERFDVRGVAYVVSGGGGAPQTGVRTEDFRTPPAFNGPEFRPFHYLLMTVGDQGAVIDTMMLQDDASWKSGDRFEIPW